MNKTEETFTENIKVTGNKVVEVLKKLIHEGNVRKIKIHDKDGKQVFEMPMTFGVVGAIISASITAIAALLVLAHDYTISVERHEKKTKSPVKK
jgi:hypothetical protein